MIRISNMNTWGYLILIAALLLLTAYMLYARFAARSREKSLHHAPSDAFTHEVTPRSEVATSEETESRLPTMDVKPVSEEPSPDSADESEKKEETYFDELQEAAAGLAMLMRSSPTSNRSEPVVFAPEHEGDALEEAESAAADADESSGVSDGEWNESGADIERVDSDSPAHQLDRAEEPASHVAVSGSDEVIESAVDSPISEAFDQVEAILSDPPVFEGENEDLSAE